MASFVQAISSRAYAKAANMHSELRKIQVSLLSDYDDVSKLTHASIHKLIKKEAHIDQNPKNSNLISGLPLSIAIKGGTKAMEKVQEFKMVTLNDLSVAKRNGMFPRGQINKIVRALPASVKPFIDMHLTVPTEITTCIPNNSQLLDILSLKSQSLQRILMKSNEAYEPINLSKIYKDQSMNNSHDWCSNLWLIKSPALRAIRLKILYKNVYSNERRFRFGLTDSPECQICKEVETVQHQLFDCRNARAMRQLVQSNYGLEFENLESLIIPGKNSREEMIKSVLLKMLIQINRSEGITEEGFKSMVKYFDKIEQMIEDNRNSG